MLKHWRAESRSAHSRLSLKNAVSHERKAPSNTVSASRWYCSPSKLSTTCPLPPTCLTSWTVTTLCPTSSPNYKHHWVLKSAMSIWDIIVTTINRKQSANNLLRRKTGRSGHEYIATNNIGENISVWLNDFVTIVTIVNMSPIEYCKPYF